MYDIMTRRFPILYFFRIALRESSCIFSLSVLIWVLLTLFPCCFFLLCFLCSHILPQNCFVCVGLSCLNIFLSTFFRQHLLVCFLRLILFVFIYVSFFLFNASNTFRNFCHLQTIWFVSSCYVLTVFFYCKNCFDWLFWVCLILFLCLWMFHWS